MLTRNYKDMIELLQVMLSDFVLSSLKSLKDTTLMRSASSSAEAPLFNAMTKHPVGPSFRAAFLAVAARGSCNVSSLVAAPQ